MRRCRNDEKCRRRGNVLAWLIKHENGEIEIATLSIPHGRSGDQAGSEAKPGVGTRCSLRPVMSTV
jgi:hypothetical protein